MVIFVGTAHNRILIFQTKYCTECKQLGHSCVKSTVLRGPGMLTWMKVSWRPYVAVNVGNKYQKRQKDKLESPAVVLQKVLLTPFIDTYERQGG